jgi:prophage regulatory protein
MKLLRPKQVAEKLSVGKTLFWKLTHREDFPRPYRLGPKHVAWADIELDTWLLTIKQGERHETQ